MGTNEGLKTMQPSARKPSVTKEVLEDAVYVTGGAVVFELIASKARDAVYHDLHDNVTPTIKQMVQDGLTETMEKVQANKGFEELVQGWLGRTAQAIKAAKIKGDKLTQADVEGLLRTFEKSNEQDDKQLGTVVEKIKGLDPQVSKAVVNEWGSWREKKLNSLVGKTPEEAAEKIVTWAPDEVVGDLKTDGVRLIEFVEEKRVATLWTNCVDGMMRGTGEWGPKLKSVRVGVKVGVKPLEPTIDAYLDKFKNALMNDYAISSGKADEIVKYIRGEIKSSLAAHGVRPQICGLVGAKTAGELIRELLDPETCACYYREFLSDVISGPAAKAASAAKLKMSEDAIRNKLVNSDLIKARAQELGEETVKRLGKGESFRDIVADFQSNNWNMEAEDYRAIIEGVCNAKTADMLVPLVITDDATGATERQISGALAKGIDKGFMRFIRLSANREWMARYGIRALVIAGLIGAGTVGVMEWKKYADKKAMREYVDTYIYPTYQEGVMGELQAASGGEKWTTGEVEDWLYAYLDKHPEKAANIRMCMEHTIDSGKLSLLYSDSGKASLDWIMSDPSFAGQKQRLERFLQENPGYKKNQ